MNLAHLLLEHGVHYKEAGDHHHCREGWLNIDCIYCSPGWNKWRLGLSLHAPAANCWVCGRHSYFQVLKELTNLSYRDLRELTSFSVERSPSSRAVGKLVLPEGLGPLGKAHRRYLGSRRIDADEAEGLWGCQGIGLSQRLAWRVFIPCLEDKEIFSWTTRHIGSSPERYINASPLEEKYPLKELLLGEHLASGSVLVVEGPLDAMRIGAGAVATMGIVFTSNQVLRISKYPKRGVCFDSEEKAQVKARELVNKLKLFPGETYLIKLKSKDPGEASDEEIRELRRFLL